MLDRDPNPSRPPDGGASRPRARPHKAKNAPKKQPQRGLGVAQLEKLRLEEQSKQEAACLASLHHGAPPLPLPLRLHQAQHQQQQHPLPSPPCLPMQIRLLEPTHAPASASSSTSSSSSSPPSSFPHLLREPCSLLSCSTLNCGSAHISYLPFAGLLAHRQGLPLSAAEENEPCLSSLSQVHDLCSPGSTVSCNVSSKQNLLNGSSWQGSHAMCFGALPQASDATTRAKNQSRDEDWDDPRTKKKDPMASLVPSPCLSEEKQTEGLIQTNSVQNEAHTIPITDLCLLHRSSQAFDAPRSSLGLPMVSIASTGIQARELSSFQMFSLSPTWSSGDQVSNRKRPWQLTLEPSRNSDFFKGVDLNNSADEVEFDASDKSSLENNDIVSGTMGASRGACSSLPNSKVFHLRGSCTEFGYLSKSLAGKVHVSSTTTFEIETPFLTLRRHDCDASHVNDAVTCGEFLTLGPSGLPSLKQGNGSVGTAVDNSCTEPLNVHNDRNSMTTCLPGQGLTEKAKDFIKLLPLVSRRGNNGTKMTSQEEIESEPFYTPLHIDMELPSYSPWHKVKNHYGSPHSNAVNDSLDLELRLSL